MSSVSAEVAEAEGRRLDKEISRIERAAMSTGSQVRLYK